LLLSFYSAVFGVFIEHAGKKRGAQNRNDDPQNVISQSKHRIGTPANLANKLE
jgi:hypothetical protein